MIERFGDVDVVVAESSAPLSAEGLDPVAGELVPTSASPLASMKEVIGAIAGGLGNELGRVRDSLAPDEVEVKLALTLSAELKAWVIGASTEHAIELTLTWKGRRDAAKA